MKLEMVYAGDEKYYPAVPQTELHVLERETRLGAGRHIGPWVYRIDNVTVDIDKYRADLADRHNLKLSHPDVDS